MIIFSFTFLSSVWKGRREVDTGYFVPKSIQTRVIFRGQKTQGMTAIREAVMQYSFVKPDYFRVSVHSRTRSLYAKFIYLNLTPVASD